MIEDRYCGKCGTKLAQMRYKDGFDTKTGYQRYTTTGTCPKYFSEPLASHDERHDHDVYMGSESHS